MSNAVSRAKNALSFEEITRSAKEWGGYTALQAGKGYTRGKALVLKAQENRVLHSLTPSASKNELVGARRPGQEVDALGDAD